MKLSEMSTRQAAGCMANMIEAVAKIVKDPKVKAAFEAAVKEKGEKAQQVSLITGIAPVLLREHLDDTAKIIATLMGKRIKDVLDQPIKQTIQDIKDVMDKDLVDFFASSGAQEQAASST